MYSSDLALAKELLKYYGGFLRVHLSFVICLNWLLEARNCGLDHRVSVAPTVVGRFGRNEEHQESEGTAVTLSDQEMSQEPKLALWGKTTFHSAPTQRTLCVGLLRKRPRRCISASTVQFL